MVVWNLDANVEYALVHSFEIREAFTYGNMRMTQKDRDKRKRIRDEASKQFPTSIPLGRWWAFRIYVKKSGKRPFDIENVPKLIVDAFSRRQIKDDKQLEYENLLGLFDDDTIEQVRMIQMSGERTMNENSMRVEIFRRKE
jgi:hypothetical protein